MRLTLRTLLAWLDGVLPGDEQQEIGAKVSSSVVATHLVDRIRAAVGRPGIGAPRTDGRGLTEDPNSVAEYLDNTLSSDQLEAFERICIESELHLAEVAACHGILAAMARDPKAQHELHGEERQRIQQRLRGLLAGLQDRAATELSATKPVGDDHRESRETARAIREAVASKAGGPATMAVGNGAAGRSKGGQTQGQPARPAANRSSVAAWASAAVAVALLLALAGVLAWSLLGGNFAGRNIRRAADVAHIEEPNAAASAPQAAVVEDAKEVVAAAAVDGEPTQGSQPESASPKPSSPPQPVASGDAAELPEVPAQPTPAVPPAAMASVQVAPPAEAAPAGAAPVPASPAASAVPLTVAAALGGPEDAVGFVGGEGVLLHLSEQTGASEWSFFPAGSPLGKREDLLVPPAFQPELHVRGVTIRLLPETRAVLSLDHDGVPRIEVVFGRVVARASRADARLGITAAGLVGTVDAGLLSPVAVEVGLERFAGADPASTPPLVRARIDAVSRGLAWRQTAAGGLPAERPLEGIDAQGMLEAGMSLEWRSTSPGRVGVIRNRPPSAWVESGERLDKLEKSAGEALAAKVAATTPLARGLREMAADKRAENRMMAAATLALLGEFDDLVEQLSAESPGRKLEQRQWLQFQDATVPLALARGGNAAQRLYDSFVNRGPHGKADALWAMARGFTDEELVAGVDRALVEALDDPSLIVRRYASKSLIDITQPSAVDRSRYRPDGLPEMRREGVNWWRGQLEKGLIRRSSTAATTVAGDSGRTSAEPAPPPTEDAAEGPAEEPAEE